MKFSNTSTRAAILAFPKSGIAYNEALYNALEREGVEVKEGTYAGRWLLKSLYKHDSIHIHWPSFFYAGKTSMVSEILAFAKFCLFLLFARIRCRAVFWTAHNLYPHNRSRTPYLDKIARWVVILLSSKVFVHRETAAKRFLKEFPIAKSKLELIDHGNWIDYYPHNISREEARLKFNIPEDKFVYLFIGLCSEYKNVDRLVEAFKQLPQDAVLLIAGKFQNQDYYAKVKEVISDITDKQIHLEAKFIPNDELQYYLLASDAVVLPYADSLTSGAAVLALGFGRPVIAPGLGYLVDVINPTNGVLYYPNEKPELVKAMEYIRTEKYSEEGIVKYAASLSWDSACKALR
ncbi:glycosyltransferase [Paremcibacter congregatus]|uniref:Glycosyl transferase family 1 domain-containing protein n=1 Tax=Paremcibacter congregatus TaxID=2043170 RepID=A0A2G4YVH7_9PROT|nr:glycosyltransferase [Paremcibacter congregatus]PHZ86240.1 hypothetical protein CRD36_06130 [Paremcibacter congregatus]QDE27206.1 glycosyltransferase [Paremcibacter congregatus]